MHVACMKYMHYYTEQLCLHDSNVELNSFKFYSIGVEDFKHSVQDKERHAIFSKHQSKQIMESCQSDHVLLVTFN